MTELLTHEPQRTPSTTVEIITPDNTARWAEASAIEATVFIDSGYVEDAAELEAEYKPYEAASRFYALEDEGDIKGVLRIIDYSKAGFKTVADAVAGKLIITEEWQYLIDKEQASMFEVGTIAVPPEHRTKDAGRASMWLYGAVLGHSRKYNLPSALASFDAEYFDGFTKKLFRDGVAPIGPAVDYMGSFTVPAYMREHEAYASICSVEDFAAIREVLDQGAQQIIDA